MAVKKATTTEDLTKSAESPAPTLEEQVARVEEATSPEMVAKVDTVKYVKVKSPTGTVTEVPEGILDALLESGYSKSK
jgi:hypothetical protein